MVLCLNKRWYLQLCSLSCPSMVRRVSIAWLSHVSKRCEMPRQAQPCRCISGLEFGSHAQAVGPGVAGEQVLPQRAQRGSPRSEEQRLTPVTNAHLVCRLQLEKKQLNYHQKKLTNNLLDLQSTTITCIS